MQLNWVQLPAPNIIFSVYHLEKFLSAEPGVNPDNCQVPPILPKKSRFKILSPTSTQKIIQSPCFTGEIYHTSDYYKRVKLKDESMPAYSILNRCFCHLAFSLLRKQKLLLGSLPQAPHSKKLTLFSTNNLITNYAFDNINQMLPFVFLFVCLAFLSKTKTI